MENIVVFDIGGTFIKYGILNLNGDILLKDKVPTPKNNCRENIPKELGQYVMELKKEYNLTGIGISTAGYVDSGKGEIVFCSENLPQYTGAKLKEVLEGATGISTFVENDVNAAALGEMWKGAAIGYKNFVCITIGTGIGGAIIINGMLYKGAGGGAGEIGHFIIDRNGEACNCGSKGCYERYASTSSFIRQYVIESRRLGVNIENIDGENIMKRVNKGEELAVRVYNEFLDNIAIGLANIAHFIDPGLIVIGGGISAQGSRFFDDINKKFKEKAMKSYSAYTKIVQAQLQNDAGIYGACYAAKHYGKY